MKKYLFYFLLLSLSCNAFKVTAQMKKRVFSSLEVVSPIAGDGNAISIVSQNDPDKSVFIDDKVKIVIKFTRAVETSSVIVGSTLLLSFPQDANARATLSWSDDNRTLTVTTIKNFTNLRGATTDQFFKLILKGSAGIRFGIRATNGHFLVGNGNPPVEAGTYSLHFTIVG
jgi:hypothetical protein